MAERTRRYLIRRVIVVLLTLFVVTLLSFLLMRLSPIDPATAYVKRNSAVVTQEQIDEARVMLGLDKPLPVQYFDWVVDALHMDFGISLGTGNPVTEELAKTVPVTLTVVAYSAVIMSLGVLGVGMLGYLWRQKAGGLTGTGDGAGLRHVLTMPRTAGGAHPPISCVSPRCGGPLAQLCPDAGAVPCQCGHCRAGVLPVWLGLPNH